MTKYQTQICRELYAIWIQVGEETMKLFMAARETTE